MCTLYNVRTSRAEIAGWFGADDAGDDLSKDYVATGRPGFVITAAAHDDGPAGPAPPRRLTTMRWGFPPPPGVKAPVVNVRNLSSPFWRTALARADRRCLVPATSFSEWSVDRNAAGRQQLHWFDIPSRPIFAFAGVWRPTGSGPAFAFLTCEPNILIGSIHPKAMPVILDEENYTPWLHADFTAACGLALPFASQLMRLVE